MINDKTLQRQHKYKASTITNQQTQQDKQLKQHTASRKEESSEMIQTIATQPATQSGRADYDHVMEQLIVENQHETAASDEANLRRRRSNEENSHDDSTGVDNVDNDDDDEEEEEEEESHLRAKEIYPCRKVIHDNDIPPNVGPPKA